MEIGKNKISIKSAISFICASSINAASCDHNNQISEKINSGSIYDQGSISTAIVGLDDDAKQSLSKITDLINEKEFEESTVFSTYGSSSVMKLLYDTTIDEEVKNEIRSIYGKDISSQPFGFINKGDGFDYYSRTFAYIKNLRGEMIPKDQFLLGEELPATAEILNSKFEKETGIKNVVDKIDNDTFAIFINFLKSKASWVDGIGSSVKKKLKLDKFDFKENKQKINRVSSLEGTFNTKFVEEKGTKFAILPASGNYGVIIGINTDKSSTNYYTAPKITKEILDKLDSSKATSVKIELPKYKFSAKTDFKEILEEKMPNTLKKSFETKMSNAKVAISKFYQIAEISFDEEGFEAKAATVMGVEKCAPRIKENTLVADHPFSFAIVNLFQSNSEPTIGNIYFEGKVVKV